MKSQKAVPLQGFGANHHGGALRSSAPLFCQLRNKDEGGSIAAVCDCLRDGVGLIGSITVLVGVAAEVGGILFSSVLLGFTAFVVTSRAIGGAGGESRLAAKIPGLEASSWDDGPHPGLFFGHPVLKTASSRLFRAKTDLFSANSRVIGG